MKSVADLGDLRGTRVLVRCDLNVPLDGSTITDDGRIRASVPTLTQLRDAGARVVVMAHLGRPKGQVNPKYSLAPAAKRLGELLGSEVTLATDVVGESAAAMVAGLGDGEIGMLENVRYEPAEESKVDAERAELAQKYASFGDVFVSDGFGVVHRKQASVYDVAALLPNAAGGLVLAEVEVLKRLTESPERPYVVVLGGAKVVVLAHLGRPKGEVNPKYSLAPAAARLSELLGVEVTLAKDVVGPSARQAVAGLADGDVALLENVRFNAGETSKDDAERGAFADQLAALADAFVSDGFGVVHRKQASVYDVAELLPSAAGLLIQTELEVLERLTRTPDSPYTVVLGGSKVSDKLAVIGALLPKVDTLLIGGGMLFTFLAAQGHKVGASLLETDQIDNVTGYLAKAAELGVEIVLPTDIVVASKFGADAEFVTTPADAIEDTPFGASGLGLDIGPDTATRFAEVISASKTVFWNGPMGVFELEPFAAGTKAVAEALTTIDGLGVVGGGDSAAAVRALGFTDDQFGHISTGGGASLEFLEGKRLPGLEVLGWQ